MKTTLRCLLVAALVAAAYLSNGLEPMDLELLDLRYRADPIPAAEDLVLVEIDERSLRRLDVWPWPRRHHAAVVDRLAAAGAARIALDVDFGSKSNPEDDRALATAIENAGGRVILGTFRQAQRGDDGGVAILETRPLPAFARHADVAAFDVVPGADGKARRLDSREGWRDGIVPHFAAFLADQHGSAPLSYYIDFSVDVTTIPRLSFADVLDGNFNPALVRGRNILIGASAVQLGDMVPVPVYRSLPGIYVQALGYSTLAKDLAVTRLHPGAVLAIAALVLIALNALRVGEAWYVSLATAALAAAAVVAGGFLVQDRFQLSIDLAPLLLLIALDLMSRPLSRIKRQDLQLLAQSLAIRRRDMQMRLLVENSFEAVLTVDRDGVLTSLNAAAEALFGVDRADVLDGPVGALSKDLRHASGEGPLPALFKSRGDRIMELTPRQGDPRTVELSFSQFRSGGEDSYICIARDITEPRRRERELTLLARRLSQVSAGVEAATSGIVLTDATHPDHPAVFVNPAFSEITGYTREDMRTLRLGFLDGPETDERANQALAEALRAGEAFQIVIRHHRKDGTAFWNDVRISPIRDDDGTILNTVWIVNDVTAAVEARETLMRAKEEAELASRSKSEFLAAMSHELRTPLNAVIGFSEVMTGETFGPMGNDAYRGYASDINASGTHLLGIINDILDIAKIESGEYKPAEENFDINRAINASTRLVGDRAREKSIELTVRPSEAPMPVRADERLMKQILLNLLSNAVKFTPDGGAVSVAAEVTNEGELAIAVRDSGIGMSEEHIATALEPFGQVQSSLSRQYEGTGLGLPLVKRFIELHGGRIEIESALGEGSKITVFLPRDRLARLGEAQAGSGDPSSKLFQAVIR